MSVDEEGFMSLMNETGDFREDLKVPENDIGKEIVDKGKKDEPFCVSAAVFVV